MPIDSPEATAAPTTRRTFLARAAAGGALVSVGVASGPLGLLTGPAGAQEAPTPISADVPLEDAGELPADDFAALATPLEMAAVLAYQRAVEGSALDAAWQDQARRFQSHHQAVVDTLTPLINPEAAAPQPDPDFQPQAGTGADQDAVLTSLAAVEDALVATHLYALSGLLQKPIAKIVGQVLAVEAQQGAVLALAAGTSIDELTPVAVTTDGSAIGVSN